MKFKKKECIEISCCLKYAKSKMSEGRRYVDFMVQVGITEIGLKLCVCLP